MDPHVDIALPHDVRKDEIEFVAPNLIVLFDILRSVGVPFLCLCRGSTLNKEAGQHEQTQESQRSRPRAQ